MLIHLIPIITTVAGSCLTLANWQEIGVVAACYQLKLLLLKPGVDLLHLLTNLPAYTGWDGETILDARLEASKGEQYVIKSPYDGSIVSINKKQLLALILQLQPDFVIFPENFEEILLKELPQNLTPLKNRSMPPSTVKPLSEATEYSLYYSHPQSNLNQATYIVGNIHLNQITTFVKTYDKNTHLKIISDLPANDAMSNKVYSNATVVDISQPNMATQFQVIEPKCQCPTCQQFTIAYLHHLSTQIPLLCQRLLIQHNIYYYQQTLTDAANTRAC